MSLPTKITAELLPLKGKYYGSHIQLRDERGNDLDCIEIWAFGGDYTPSEREIEGWDESEYGPYEVCDSHFESAFGYRICQLIVKAINGGAHIPSFDDMRSY